MTGIAKQFLHTLSILLTLFHIPLSGQSTLIDHQIDSIENIINSGNTNDISKAINLFALSQCLLLKSEYEKGLKTLIQARKLAISGNYGLGEGMYFKCLSIFHRHNANSYNIDLKNTLEERATKIFNTSGNNINTDLFCYSENKEFDSEFERNQLFTAFTALNNSGYSEEIANICYSLQYNLLNDNKIDSSILYSQLAEINFKKANKSEELFLVIADRMLAYHLLNRKDESISEELKANNYIDNAPSLEIKGNVLEMMALRYDEMRRFSSLLKCFLTSSEIWKFLGLKKKQAKSLNMLGTYYSVANGNTTKEYQYLKESLALKKEINDNENIYELYSNLTMTALNNKDFEGALKYLALAKGLTTNESNDYQLGRLADAEGQVLLGLNNYSDAIEKFKQSANFFSAKQFVIFQSYQFYNLGLCYKYLNQYDESLKNTKLAYEISTNQNWNDVRLKSCLLIADLLKLKNNYSKAFEFMQIYTTIKEDEALKSDRVKINELETELLVNQRKAKYEAELISLNAQLEKQRNTKRIVVLISLLIILAAGLIYYILSKNQRLKQSNLLMSEKLKAQESVLKERSRISRELHDEIGSTLSGISMYSHIANKQIEKTPNFEVLKSLHIMRESANDMVSKLNEIVWLTNPDQDSFVKLIQRLDEYGNELANAKGINFCTTVSENISKLHLTAETRRNLFLICKEGINNAIKYSNCTKLDLETYDYDAALNILIKDNGKGFNVNNQKPGNGLINMKKRAEEIGADFRINTATDQGCELSLILKLNQIL